MTRVTEPDAGVSRDPGLLIMISLAGGPRHGFAMMQDIEAFSGRRLGPGTLYGALERLEGDGFVVSMATDDRRRPYRLTDRGMSELDARLSGLSHLAQVGASRRAAQPGSAR